ncbi:hypothetical protein HXY33_00030 [Candidatus Bathyarchaeota archaeon]|nr:hypothetical protein [Candidatus Bathyarchaeota archaeon]
MKKTALALTATIIIVIILISIPLSIRTVEASNGDYSIEFVNHAIKILYNGYVLINDTITISGQGPNVFFMGFPIKYQPYILQALAYNESDSFPVSLNVSFEGRIGFYGVRINFTHGTAQTFNVGFIVSNILLSQNPENTSYYLLDFPAFPSFTKPVATCNGSIVLEGATYVNGSQPVTGFNYQQYNLTAFTLSPGYVIFQLTDSSVQLMAVKELNREIIVNEIGEIAVSDGYYVTNTGLSELSAVEVILPLNASVLRTTDQFGRTLSDSSFIDEKIGRYNVSFALPVETNGSAWFFVQYSLPSQIYLSAQGGTNLFNLTLLQFLNVSYYVEQASIAFVLPEGARISTYTNFNIAKGPFQESLTINLADISPLSLIVSTTALQVAYEYNPLWLAFRPTLWMWAIAIVGCSVFGIWKRPKIPERISTMPVAISAKLRLEDIKSFISAYDEKRKITLEIESLESRAQRGKIPRRRYKVQRKILETRLNSLSRTINESEEKMRAAGGQYAELVRQLEIAENEIDEVEANIKSIEARHSRGDLLLEAYRKFLTDYQRRREKANTTIDGILLRLREESR